MIKKNIALLTIFIISLGMVACATNPKKYDDTPATSITKTELKDNNTQNSVISNSDEKNQNGDAVSSEVSPQYIINNEVIIDNEYCVVKIVNIENSKYGPKIKLYSENKMSDTTLLFLWDDVAINGYIIDPWWAEDVAPGKKSNAVSSVDKDKLDEVGIKTIDKIEFNLRVEDSDHTSIEYVNDTFVVYPTGKTEDEIVVPDVTDGRGTLVLDNESCKFVILNTFKTSSYYKLTVYLENKTSKKLTFDTENESVNGFMISPYWMEYVAAHSRKIDTIEFPLSMFEVNDIKEVEEIEYTLVVHETGNYSAEDVVNDTFIYKKNNDTSEKDKDSIQIFDIATSTYVVREGHYSGGLTNGIPNGHGVFTTENEAGEQYTITGDFIEGKLDGLCTIEFENNFNRYEFIYSNGVLLSGKWYNFDDLEAEFVLEGTELKYK